MMAVKNQECPFPLTLSLTIVGKLFYSNSDSVCAPKVLATFPATGLKQKLAPFTGFCLLLPLAKLPPESAGPASDNLCFSPPSS